MRQVALIWARVVSLLALNVQPSLGLGLYRSRVLGIWEAYLFKAIWLSDLHYTTDETIIGHDPRARLNAAISHINTHYSDADICIISGDLVDRETHADYTELKETLAQLSVPYLPMMGNHDDRTLMRQVLDFPDTVMDKFIQYWFERDDSVFLALDTKIKGDDAGKLSKKRLNWVDKTLHKFRDRDVFVFMHHPPMNLGLPLMDGLKLENGAEFLDIVSKYDCVKHLFMGHVHRPISGSVRGIPFNVMRSITYQAPPPRPVWGWDTFSPVREAPAYGVIDISQESVLVQYIEFCEVDFGVTSAD